MTTLFRQSRGNSGAGAVVVQTAAGKVGRSRRRWHMKTIALVATLIWVCVASSASALIISPGSPSYSLPGGGSCSVSGFAIQTSGATVTCTGLSLSSHTKVYFGIKNNTDVNGNTMTGAAPTAGSAQVFRYDSETANSITYTSTTTIADILNGTIPTNNQLVLTRTGGSATIVSAGGNPANNTRGDITSLFQITSGTTFTVRVDVKASNSLHALGQAGPAVFDPTHTAIGLTDFSKVDLGFYFSDCGDGTVDSPEVCDLGANNGLLTSCCTSTCTFRAAGQVCRAGPGAPCDASETCTGVAGSCPSDDAPLNFGVVCNTGTGDICDANETCTGTPGEGCPPDDAPSNIGTVCRASTTGDVCDEDEVCTGVPDQPCPPNDAPGKLNFVCRSGSGDICDPDEKCTGVPGQACPPDIVSNPTTVCRTGSGDVCDPNETCTAIATQPCPPDVVQPSSFVCRGAAGVCDVQEQCTGSAGQTCPANSFVSAGTSCNVDNNVCTVDECDGSGNCALDSNMDCDDMNSCTQDSCDPINGCEYDGAPSTSCVGPVKAVFKYKNKDLDKRDKAIFVWRGGPSLIGDQGDPTQGTRYELCVYDDTGVQMAMGVDGGPGWDTLGSPSSPKGYKYKDTAAASDGVKLIKTKASNLDKAKAKLVAKGDAMPDTATLPFQFPVTAQLYASDGMCWEAEFGSGETTKNDDGGYTGKTTGP